MKGGNRSTLEGEHQPHSPDLEPSWGAMMCSANAARSWTGTNLFIAPGWGSSEWRRAVASPGKSFASPVTARIRKGKVLSDRFEREGWLGSGRCVECVRSSSRVPVGTQDPKIPAQHGKILPRTASFGLGFERLPIGRALMAYSGRPDGRDSGF